jgi:hypothetical protein
MEIPAYISDVFGVLVFCPAPGRVGEAMSKYLAASTIFGKLRLWLKSQIVSDVPPELALCEFGCRKTQCRFDEWAHCEKRLSYLAGKAHSGDASPTNAE